MSKSYVKRKKEQKQRRLAILRYILPFSFSAALTLLFSLPLIYFTDHAGENTARTSVFARISENFSAARTALLDPSVEDAAYLNFSSLAMSVCVILMLLFAIGVLATALYAITGLAHIYLSDKNSKLRRLFVTAVPNKAVILALTLLCAAPAFFPMILINLIDRILMVYAKAHYVAGNPLIYCLLLWCATVAFFIVTEKHDADELNIFAKRKKKESLPDEPEEEAEVSDTSALYRMTKLSKEEQAENIRKLLNRTKNDNE